jgi:hypothetical protein
MKRKFKQCWSTIPPVSTKQTITSRIKSLNIKKDHGVGNPGPDLGPAQVLLILLELLTMHFHIVKMYKDKEVNKNVINIFLSMCDVKVTVLVNNSTSINKTNNHLSHQIIEHKKRPWCWKSRT